MVGKLKTAAQMGAIVLLLLDGPLPGGMFHARELGTWLIYIAAALTIWSMVYYLKKALPDLIVMDTVPALCNGTFPCELASSSFSFYEDSQHLSVRGASKVARELLPKIGFTHAAPNSVAWVQ